MTSAGNDIDFILTAGSIINTVTFLRWPVGDVRALDEVIRMCLLQNCNLIGYIHVSETAFPNASVKYSDVLKKFTEK